MERKIMVEFRGEHRQIEIKLAKRALSWNFVGMNEADFIALELTDDEELAIFNMILSHGEAGQWR